MTGFWSSLLDYLPSRTVTFPNIYSPCTKKRISLLLSTFKAKFLYSRIIKTLKKSSNKQVLQNLAAGGFHEFVEYAILRQKVRNGDFSGYKLEKESTLFDNGAKTRHWNSIIDRLWTSKSFSIIKLPIWIWKVLFLYRSFFSFQR